MNRKLFLSAFALLGVAGCRAHPCGDRSAELPAELAALPLIEDGGKVCYVHQGQADIMYWGGKEKRAEISTRLVIKMNAAGWAQFDLSGPYAPPPREGEFRFRKDDQKLFVQVTQSQTPRMGAKIPTDSIQVTVHPIRRTPAR